MTATMTAAGYRGRQRSRRARTGPRDLPPGEWERLLRERSYLRPLPVPPALHQMAGRRRDLAEAPDGQA